jgi:hypothetical protein
MSSRVFGGIERDEAEPQPAHWSAACMRLHIVRRLRSVLSSLYASAFYWTKLAGGVEWGVVEVGDVGELVAS